MKRGKKQEENIKLHRTIHETENGAANRHIGHGRRGPHGPGGPGGPGGAQGGEKAADFRGSMGKLIRYCKPFALVVLIAVICDMCSVIARLIGPNKISKITDYITQGLTGEIDLPAIFSICWFLLVLYIAGALLNYTTALIMTIVTQRVNKGLRGEISVKINRLPVAYFQQTTTGDVLSRVTNDVDMIGQTMQNSVAMLVSAVTMFIGSVFMMFYTNWIMALTAIVASLIGFVFMMLIVSHSQQYFSARQKWLGKMNGHVEEIYTGHNVVKLFNAEGKEKETFDYLNNKMYESNWKSQFFSGLMMPLMTFVGNFGYVAVCVVGAMLAMNGVIQFGTIVAFIMYVRLFTSPLSQLAQAATQLQSTAAAAERVFDFLGAQEMEDESAKPAVPAQVRGEVEFSHVHFGYEPGKSIIHDFSEHILPGQKVAIVGPTGAGKTTMVNLLMRFYEVDSGEIRIDGIPTTQMKREDVHAMFGMVLQDTWLFEGTVRENLTYGKEGITDEQLDLACKAAGLYHFVQTLPNGYDTPMDDKMSLSAGQKQLMTIARAMIENAPMLILDEATSSVDTRTEVLIQKAMDRLTAGRTSFVIAHRLSTIRDADIILVMNHGDIVESGTHEQLLAQGGFYSELYNSQFEVA